uniref:Uncharacterized protein n=1 Tax=Anguilla anguilla TaxID=7936 RepID=A0A0E9SYX9_ANGAN
MCSQCKYDSKEESLLPGIFFK